MLEKNPKTPIFMGLQRRDRPVKCIETFRLSYDLEHKEYKQTHLHVYSRKLCGYIQLFST